MFHQQIFIHISPFHWQQLPCGNYYPSSRLRFNTYFINGLLVIAGGVMAEHYSAIIWVNSGCPLVITIGPSETGTSTAIRSALSLTGNHHSFYILEFYIWITCVPTPFLPLMIYYTCFRCEAQHLCQGEQCLFLGEGIPLFAAICHWWCTENQQEWGLCQRSCWSL